MAAATSGEKPVPKLPPGIRKEVLTPADPGEQLRPQKGDLVDVHYVGRFYTDGDEFDSSRNRGAPLSFELGGGQVIDGWELAVATMHRGELSRFTVAPEYAYGEQGCPPKIPGSATLTFEIELLDWKSKDDLLGDGSVIKTILEKGSGSEAGEGTDLLISLKVSAADGRVLDEKLSFEYRMGADTLGRLGRAIDKALDEMRKGGRVSLACSGEYADSFNEQGTVTAELELLYVYEVVDVSPGKDEIVTKRRISDAGCYQKPKDAGVAMLSVEAVTDEAGTPLPGFRGPTDIELTVGDGEVCDALEYAILEMTEGERAVVTCSRPSMCADAQLGLENLAKAESNFKVLMTVLLAQFENGKPTWDMSMEEKVEYAFERKEIGGKLFKAQRYGLALQRYTKVAEFLRSYIRVPEGGEDLARVCELNRAACMLKLEDHFGAKAACTTVLAEDPGNVKALFRRASAYFALHEYTEAATDLRKLLELEPANKDAQRLLPQALRGAKQEEKKASSMFAKMNKAFSGFADEEARRHQEKKDAREAEIARKGAAAKAEAKKMREEGRMPSADQAKEDMMRASEGIANMQRQIREMEMKNRFGDMDD